MLILVLPVDLPFADTVSMVTFFRQALALDERRVKFQPEFRHHSRNGHAADIAGIPRNKEVWFLGVHTSVGGGADSDDGPSLANVPFRWMLWEAVQCGLRTGPIGILQSYALMAIPTVAHQVQGFMPAEIATHLQAYVLPRISFSQYYTKIIKDAFTEDRREDIVRLAAQYDTAMSIVAADAQNGLPMTPDLRHRKEESLQGVYLPMEYVAFVIQRRWYQVDADGRYVERRDRR
jgi:hypothetical protein